MPLKCHVLLKKMIKMNSKKLNINDYFSKILSAQDSSIQDTYLLVDNLYEKNVSCIDTWTLFKYLKAEGYKAVYLLYKENPFYKELLAKNALDDSIVVINNSTLVDDIELYIKLKDILPTIKYLIVSFPDSIHKEIREFILKNKKIKLVSVGHGPMFFKTSLLKPKFSNYILKDQFDFYVVSSDIEKKKFLNHGWPEYKLLNVGLPRFDAYQKVNSDTKNIVIMFTWRLLSFRSSKNLEKYRYFNSLKSFLDNPYLKKLASTPGYKVTIAPHHSLEALNNIKLDIPDEFKIADTTKLIDLINSADLFITDYSSIVHDFMFMETPVIFYRLDYGDPLLDPIDSSDIITSKYKDDLLFNIFYNEDDVIDKIRYYVQNNFEFEEQFKLKASKFFDNKTNFCQKLVKELEEKYSLPKHVSQIAKDLKPIWDDKIAVCMSSSNEYVPYLSVYLDSLIKHSAGPLDIIVFESKITDSNKKELLKLNSEKVSIRFFNPEVYLDNFDLFVSAKNFSRECYYRLVSPYALSSYRKIIFTDLDMLVQDNILDLDKVDMGDYPIAACQEPVWPWLFIHKITIRGQYYVPDYTQKVLKIDDPTEYYNTGLIVIDVNNFNKGEYFNKIFDFIAENKLIFQEQDAINSIFRGLIYKLPPEWNYELSDTVRFNEYNHEYLIDYKNNVENAKILHYLGAQKPWNNMNVWYADRWWEYAKNSPYFGSIFHRYVSQKNRNDITNNIIVSKRDLYFVFNRNKFFFKYKLYSFLSKLLANKHKRLLARKLKYKEMFVESKKIISKLN